MDPLTYGGGQYKHVLTFDQFVEARITSGEDSPELETMLRYRPDTFDTADGNESNTDFVYPEVRDDLHNSPHAFWKGLRRHTGNPK